MRGAARCIQTLRPAPIVCGLHLKRGFRLAFTIQPPDEPEGATRVVILYVGQREPRHAESDVWTVLHDLLGVENPPADHLRPPCCEDGLPEVSQADLDAFLDELQRMDAETAVPSPSISSRHVMTVTPVRSLQRRGC